jgi:MFS family permease
MQETEDREIVPASSWYALAILTFVYIVSFIDRQVLSILAESIKLDLGLDDAQLGFLYGTAFAIFYALFGIPLGRLADGWNRVWLVAFGLVGWSVMTSLSGFAATFTLLAIARIGVGIGEASTSPAAYSLITQLFPQRRRATALAIYASGLYIGLGLSLPIGGMLLSLWESLYPGAAGAPLGLSPWQATFVLIGLPGLLIALLVLTVRDPAWTARSQNKAVWSDFGKELAAILPPFTLISAARIPGELPRNLIAAALLATVAAGMVWLAGDPAQWIVYAVGLYAVYSWVRSLRSRDPATHALIWGTPVTVLLVIAFGAIAFITYATMFWASPYALRTFYTARTDPALILVGRTALHEVSTFVGWGSAIGSAAGVIFGGMIADRWHRIDSRGRLFTIAASLTFSAPLIVLMFTTGALATFYMVTPLAAFVGSAYSGAAIATIQDLVLPRMRATAGATFLLGITLVGLALGPYVAGKVGAVSGSLRIGILSLFAIAPIALGLLWYCAGRLEALVASREVRAGESI